MSTPQSPATLATTHWFPELNFGRGAGTVFPSDEAKVGGEDNVLVDSFAQAGRWLPTFPVETMLISKEQADKAVAQRTEWLKAAELAAKASEIGKLVLAILTVRYTDKKGVIRPTMLGVTGNRRSAAIDLGFVRRLGKFAPDDSPDAWPGPSSRKGSESHEAWVRRLCSFDFHFVYRTDVKSEDDMLILQIEENELRNAGAKKVSLAKNLEHVRKLLQHGRSQADITRIYSSIGQKYTQVCLFDMQNPQVGLIERIGLKAKDPRAIPFGKLPNSLAGLIAATHPDPKEIEKFNSRKGREEKDKVTSMVGKLDQIELALKAIVGPKPDEVAMMDKDTITKQMSVHSQNPLICDVFRAVKENETGLLAKASDLTAAVRSLYVIAGDPEEFQKIENQLIKLADDMTAKASKAAAKVSA